MNLENYFISLFKNKHIGDDGAVVGNLVYSKDAFFENVHFKTDWMDYENVAKKAMLVNISDAISMNAIPKYALLSVAMPKSMSKKDMASLARGFNLIAKRYNIEIIGGDTISNTKLDITITIISEVKKPLYRDLVKSNCLFAYTGTLGQSSKDLKRVFNLGNLHKKSKFLDIQLRDKFVYKSCRYLKAGMDISDGLYSDLDKMSKASGVGVRFLKIIPKNIACSGEEYEMLIAFDIRDKKTILRRAKQTRTDITIFAKATRNRYKNRCKAHHF